MFWKYWAQSGEEKGAKNVFQVFVTVWSAFFHHNSFHGRIKATNSLAFTLEKKLKTKTNWNSILRFFPACLREIIDILKANVAHEVWSSCKINWTVRCRRARLIVAKHSLSSYSFCIYSESELQNRCEFCMLVDVNWRISGSWNANRMETK